MCGHDAIQVADHDLDSVADLHQLTELAVAGLQCSGGWGAGTPSDHQRSRVLDKVLLPQLQILNVDMMTALHVSIGLCDVAEVDACDGCCF